MDFAFSLEQVQTFMIVLFRVAALIFSAPLFAGNSVPITIKAGLTFWLTIVFLPLAGQMGIPATMDAFTLTLAITQEILVGITIGFVAQVVVVIGTFGGHIVGKHMGLAIANVLDPMSGLNVSIIGSMLNIFIIMILLGFDYHLILLNIVYSSYEIIPPLGVAFSIELIPLLVEVGGKIFIFALQIVAPVFAGLFFLEIMIALMSKLGRQFNVLMLQFPIKIFVGLTIFPVALIRLPESVQYMIDWFLRTVHQVFTLISG